MSHRPDWSCPNCGVNCFGSKSSCFKCGTHQPASSTPTTTVPVPSRPRLPDWRCSTCCLTIFGSKDACNKCGTRNPGLVSWLATQSAPAAATPPAVAQPAGRPCDWTCPACYVTVFGSKLHCFKCGAARPANPAAAQATAPSQPPTAPAPRKLPDWPCKTCNIIVFGSKAGCLRCGAPNPGLMPTGDTNAAAALAALAQRERDLAERERVARERARELEEQLALARQGEASAAKVDQLNQELQSVEQRLRGLQDAEAAQSFSSIVPPPPYWSAENGFQLVPITDAHDLSCLAVLVNCCDAPRNVSVIRAFRVQNPRLWVQYCTQRHFLEQDRPSALSVEPNTMKLLRSTAAEDQIPSVAFLRNEANEVYAFHGTKPGFTDIICREGFDERVCALGGLFGAGVYFADRFTKSHAYTQAGTDKLRPMFISRVSLGRMTNPTTVHRSQERRAPEGYDSVCGQASAGAAHEFIVYDRRQTYPEFLIWYSC